MNIKKIKTLREKTQASYAECKKALNESDQDIKLAEHILMEKGMKIVNAPITMKNSSKTNNGLPTGVVSAYIHPGSRVGVLVETHCCTDFVARTDEFQKFVKEVALQIASMRPGYISSDDIDDDELIAERDRRIMCRDREGVPGHLIDEMVGAELVQWFSETCLLEQTYVKDNSKIVKELLAELINKVGEPCKIKRFVRWEIGADNGEIKMSKEEEHVEEENIQEMKYDLMKKRFKPAIFIMLGVPCLIIALMLLAC